MGKSLPSSWRSLSKTNKPFEAIPMDLRHLLTLLPIAFRFPLLGAEFHLNNQQLSLLTGVNVITLGFANILIVPLSNIFGRRPISIIFGLLVVLTNIWQALATSHSSFLAARACNGLVAATSETIMVQVIADVYVCAGTRYPVHILIMSPRFFLHERGFWMGAYFTLYFSGAFLGPIMSGNLAARTRDWRPFFWLTVGLAAFVTVLLIFAFPETKWQRNTVNHAGVKQGKKSDDKVQEAVVDSEASSERSGAGGAAVGRGKPGRKQFMPMQKPDSDWWKYVVRDITTPIIVFFNPIVFWAALMLMGPADLLLLFNLTESPLFTSPAYRFTPGQVGYANFAFFVGGVIGVATAGPFSDWLARRATIKNNGIREAEMRLPALIPFVCLYIVSHVVGAVGYQRAWPWPAIIVCGFGFSGLAVTSIPAISIAYAVDCYKPISGEIMVVATVLKNVLGFCLSYWVFKIAATRGFVAVYMIQFAYDMLPIVLTVPLYIWGKNLRRWTKNSDIHKRRL